VSLTKIISGGQTGVDRLALDVAIEAKMEHGGFCPKDRRAEGGPIPEHYQLDELGTSNYQVRTRHNVEAADATVIFMDREDSPGSRLTTRTCQQLGKPYYWIRIADLDVSIDNHVAMVAEMLEATSAKTLNVAGTRGSKCRPEFLERVREILWGVLAVNA